MPESLRPRVSRALSRRLAGDAPLVFRPPEGERPPPPPPSSAGVYVHVPFCRSLCPYCPYLRVSYEAGAAADYVRAVRREIRTRAAAATAASGMAVPSVYFGGGTPTVLDEGLDRIVETLREAIPATARATWCIETNPGELSDEGIERLRRLGFDALSVGVQSFHDAELRTLGRPYAPTVARAALARLDGAGFATVNVDLMFALPGQTEAAFATDLETTLAHAAVTQVTAYPLFTFPSGPVQTHARTRRLRLPPFFTRRRMYFRFHDTMREQGFAPASVWSFTKGDGRYSSVTRERYLGFGPGAASYYETEFTLNTFDLIAYGQAVDKRGEATALVADFPEERRKLFDFYWRLYDGFLPERRTLATTAYTLTEEPRFARWVSWGRRLGWLRREPEGYRLTRRGLFWGHWLQNRYAMDRLARLWSHGQSSAWPTGIIL